MSRNPILSDKAFQEAAPGGVTTGGPSPAEEWQRAQDLRAGTQGAGGAVAPPAPGTPVPPVGPGTAATGGAGTFRPGRGPGVPTGTVTDGKVMTMGGVASATFVMFAFLLLAAWYGWQAVDVVRQPGVDLNGQAVYSATFTSPGLLFVALFAALGLAVLTAFKPRFARVTGILYALCEGYVLGSISAYFGALYQGIVAQAVLATLGVFLVMLALYGLRVLRATPRFVKGVIAATIGIALMYGVVLIANLFGFGEGFWTSGSPLGVIISVVVVIVAAMNLILDFDFIEKGSQNGLPRYMDWYAAFGLMVTLVWLYLELLRLLARLRQ